VTDLAHLVRGLAALRGTDGPRLLAVGWATVDIERTVRELGGHDGAHARPVGDEPLLGATAWRLDAGGVAILILEPTTEGRLAAALARRGEGICALYLATDGDVGGAFRMTTLGLPGRLLPHDHPWGPFVVEVHAGAM
jgi:hypothetical protein